MTERILQKLLNAELIGLALMVTAVNVLSYGISQSLTDTNTNSFISICLAALTIGFLLGKTRWHWLLSWLMIIVVGGLTVWILSARLSQPLQVFGREVWAVTPQIIPAIRYKEVIDTTAIADAWKAIAEPSSILWMRVQSWLVGLDQDVKVNDPLVRNMIWVLALWYCSSWMGWFGTRRNAVLSLIPSLALLTSVLSYSEYRVETLWGMVVILLVLLGVWNYKNHTQQWKKSRIDYSDSISYDNGQAVLLLTVAIGALAFITPSVTWQDIVDIMREFQKDDTAEMLGIQPPPPSGKPAVSQKPALPRDHLLTGGLANSEKVVMTIKTGELPSIPYQSLTISVPQYYWRSTIYDKYVGSGWVTTSLSPQKIPSKTPLIPGLLSGYRVVRLNVDMVEPEGRLFWSGVLFSANIPFTADWRVRPTSDLFAEQTALLQADMFAALSNATSYTADIYVPTVTAEQLRAAPREYPDELPVQYFTLPHSIPDRVRTLARQITSGTTNPYDKAKLIETFLRTNYPYDLNVPAPPEGRDVADYFLFDLQKGYCDYYATTMVVLARASGLPARFVSGYAPSYYDTLRAEYVVRELNAHSWAEIYFPTIGWIEFEPTASIPEIDRAGGGIAPPNEKPEDKTVSNLLTLFRLEKIATWTSPIVIMILAGIIYFLFMERWIYLRLAPGMAIERIYQNFYRTGRRFAGAWTYAETSSEFLYKLTHGINEIGSHSRFAKSFDDLVRNANDLTMLYHSTLFKSHQTQKQGARTAWQVWKRLRLQLFLARLFTTTMIIYHRVVDMFI